MANHQPHSGFQGKIGIAREDITPPIGIYSRNWGAAAHDTADAIHRSLTLTALTLAPSSGGIPLVLIDADLGWWRPLDLFQRFQERLLAELSLPPERFIFALTHTHAAAPLMEADPRLSGSDLLTPWLERIYQATVSATGRALAEAEVSRLDWHQGRCALAAHRDFPDPDASQDRVICGFNPAAPADDTLLVGRVTDGHGNVRATLVNYACHPTTLAWSNTKISPDFVGAMRETIETATGGVAFFLQGMSGDTAPREQYVGDTQVADRHGRQLAFAALSTLHDMAPPGHQLCFSEVVESGAPLAVWKYQTHPMSTQLRAKETAADLTLKNWPSADELEQQRLACSDRALQERLLRKRDIRRALGDGISYVLPVYTWRIGDTILVGCAAEAYSQLQQNLRGRFPTATIVCMNLINGSVGYLPPADRFDVDLYPVWQTPFAHGCLETMTETMASTIRELLD